MCVCVRARTRPFPLTFSPVLAAAVTQASLRSVLHKLLAAGPAFNITALLSAAQHSNQGTASSLSIHPHQLLFLPFKGSCVCFGIDYILRLPFLAIVKKASKWSFGIERNSLSLYFSPALQSVARLPDVRGVVTAAVRVATQQYAAKQPEVPSPQQHGVRTNKGERSHFHVSVASVFL